MRVAAGLSVIIPANQTLTDTGSVSFTNDTVTYDDAYQSTTVINVNGALTATSTLFNSQGYTSQLNLNSGGTLSVSNTAFGISNISLNSGSNDTLSANTFSSSTVTTINSGATISFSANDLSSIPANGIVASGNPGATLHLNYNYWGLTDPTAIGLKILDSLDPTVGTRPLVDFSHYLNSTTGISAYPVSVPFKTTSQMINITAQVNDGAGDIINEGMVTFTILDGSTQVGQTTTPMPVSNNDATATYALPANAHFGNYTIEAVYTDPATASVPSPLYLGRPTRCTC